MIDPEIRKEIGDDATEKISSYPRMVIHCSPCSQIFLDGVKLKCVSGFHIDYKNGSCPKVILEIIPGELVIGNSRFPELPDELKPYYTTYTELIENGLITKDQFDDYLKKNNCFVREVK